MLLVGNIKVKFKFLWNVPYYNFQKKLIGHHRASLVLIEFSGESNFCLFCFYDGLDSYEIQ